MDDYKKGLYLEARRLVHKEVFLCNALKAALRDQGHQVDITDEDMREYFPEFLELFSGKCFAEYGIILHVTDPHRIWWAEYSPTPRIHMIDFLLGREDNSRAHRA